MLEYTRWPLAKDKHRAAVAAVADSGLWHFGDRYADLERRLTAWLGIYTLTTSSYFFCSVNKLMRPS